MKTNRPKWLELLNHWFGLHEERPHIVVMGTVDDQGMPQLRHVVLRHIDQNGRMLFAVDRRSAKCRQLDQQPQVSLCLYDRVHRVQLRLQGTAVRFDVGTALATEQWQNMSEELKRSFLLDPPGERRHAPHSWVGDLRRTHDPEMVKPCPDFSVLRVTINHADCVDLGCFPIDRRIEQYHGDEGWQQELVWP